VDLEQAQEWTERFLAERPGTGAAVEALRPADVFAETELVEETDASRRRFSPFLIEDAERAREIARELMLAADAAPDDPFAAVAERTEELAATEGEGAVRFAVKVFLTHHPVGRRVRIPPLELRAPAKVLPSAPEPAFEFEELGAEAVGAVEAQLNWWREDPEANEHHDHWHVVYPNSGVPAPAPGDPGRTQLKDRQGELFLYMHEQMLARYDTERIAVGLEPVEPLADHAGPIPEGYDPNTGLEGFPAEWTDGLVPRPRPDGARMPDTITFTTAQGPVTVKRTDELDAPLDRLTTAAQSDVLTRQGGGTFSFTDIDPLGHAIERSSATVPAHPGQPQPSAAQYRNFHGMGHVFLSEAAGRPEGVMADTDTAIRDPVFYRWHRHVDDLGFAWQERQTPHPLTDVGAPVELRRAAQHAPGRPAESPDIVLLRDLPADLDDDALAAHVTDLIGGAHFDDDVADTAPGTAQLRTRMLTRKLDIAEVPGSPDLPTVTIPYLDQEEFAYAVRMRNTAGAPHLVTVRLFFVADALFDQRRMWIELDRFAHTVEGETSVAVRHARASAVIRKPGSKPPGPTRHSPAPIAGNPTPNVNAYCDCGWPYNLLLPRGTGDGMRFWLAAVVTDGGKDQVQASTCGSMSFCGARDRYPDARPMGYPFDRPFTSGIAAALDALPSVAARSFTIRWMNPDFTP
jgi:tyrosinase